MRASTGVYVLRMSDSEGVTSEMNVTISLILSLTSKIC